MLIKITSQVIVLYYITWNIKVIPDKLKMSSILFGMSYINHMYFIIIVYLIIKPWV